VTSNQFFVKKLPEGPDLFSLEGEENYHLYRVARIKREEKIWLTDGSGRKLLTVVEEVGPEKSWLRPVTLIEEKLNCRLILGLGLTRVDTFEFIIQKATELGVAEIWPLHTLRSQPLPADRLRKRMERWQKIALAALKQSKGALLPAIKEPVSLDKAMDILQTRLKLYLDEDSQEYFRDILIQEKATSVCLMVGPEGGWADEEKDSLKKAKFQGLSLGGRVLRTETAALAALSLISHFWNW